MARGEAIQEWTNAGVSAGRMYGSFFYWLFREPFPTRQLGQQIVRVMLEGFGIMMIAAVVQGGLFAWLGGWYGGKFSIVNWGGAAGMFLMLASSTTLIGAMMFAARIGTAFTVEIGSMQMSGQLDALRLMAVEPTQHIVIPRILASIICLPILKALSDAVAVGSGALFSRLWFDISFPVYFQHAESVLRSTILTTSYIRCMFHGFFVSMNACALGYYFQGGAIELGKTTTKSIVINLITVIVIDTIYSVADTLLGMERGVIQARGVSFSFGRNAVLVDLDLDVEESLTTVVVGRSGIGKSVLLKCMTGLLTPSAGSITIDGQEVVGAERAPLREIRKRIGMLFQEGALFDSLDVYENVAFPLSYHRIFSAAEIDRKVTAYLDLVEMRDSARAMPQELSGGMRRKVAIARAMIQEPRYLLYDEPTSGLDPTSAAVVESMIRRLQQERAITSLVVTHDIDLTRYIADRIALMEDGRILTVLTRETAFLEGSPIDEHFIKRRERIRAGNGN